MFWENFVYLCNKRGVSPNAVAVECGIKSSGTVSGWKNGASPYKKTLQRIADYFGVSVADLTGEFIPVKEKAPARSGRREVNDEDLKFALYGEPADELTDEDMKAIREYAEYIRQKRKGEKK